MKILHLEDDEFDVELTSIWCRGEWSDCEIIAASNPADYVSVLKSHKLDGIVSDSGVHGLTGSEAVELARQHAPGVPFVFLCGSLSEEKHGELLMALPDAMVSKNDPEEIRAVFARHFRRT